MRSGFEEPATACGTSSRGAQGKCAAVLLQPPGTPAGAQCSAARLGTHPALCLLRALSSFMTPGLMGRGADLVLGCRFSTCVVRHDQRESGSPALPLGLPLCRGSTCVWALEASPGWPPQPTQTIPAYWRRCS